MLRNLKFLVTEVQDKTIIQCNEYPVINATGDSFDDAMEQMALILLVHLRGIRTVRRYRLEKV